MKREVFIFFYVTLSNLHCKEVYETDSVTKKGFKVSAVNSMNTELMANITCVEYTENFRVTKRLSSNSFFYYYQFKCNFLFKAFVFWIVVF